MVGVFTVGGIRVLIRPEWIEVLAGQNTLLGNLAGLIYGSWIDGTSLGLIVLYLALFLAALAGVLWWMNRRNQVNDPASTSAD